MNKSSVKTSIITKCIYLTLNNWKNKFQILKEFSTSSICKLTNIKKYYSKKQKWSFNKSNLFYKLNCKIKRIKTPWSFWKKSLKGWAKSCKSEIRRKKICLNQLRRIRVCLLKRKTNWRRRRVANGGKYFLTLIRILWRRVMDRSREESRWTTTSTATLTLLTTLLLSAHLAEAPNPKEY